MRDTFRERRERADFGDADVVEQDVRCVGDDDEKESVREEVLCEKPQWHAEKQHAKRLLHPGAPVMLRLAQLPSHDDVQVDKDREHEREEERLRQCDAQEQEDVGRDDEMCDGMHEGNSSFDRLYIRGEYSYTETFKEYGMARHIACTLTLLLGITATPVLGKHDAVTQLKAEQLDAFLKSSAQTVVRYRASGDTKSSTYEKEFAKFCESTPAVHCGSFNIDSDFGGKAGEYNVLLRTPIIGLYDAEGKEIGRLEGPKTKEEIAQKVAETYK